MEYIKLSNTELMVSKIALGCMRLSLKTVDEVEKLVEEALNLGINFFDIANGYSAGTSEEYLGRAIKNNVARDKVVIATKFNAI